MAKKEGKTGWHIPSDLGMMLRYWLVSVAVMSAALGLLGGCVTEPETIREEAPFDEAAGAACVCLAPYCREPESLACSVAAGATADVLNEDLLAQALETLVPDAPYVVRVSYGAVLLNRVKSPLFADTLTGVLTAAGLYPTQDVRVSERTAHAARDAMLGLDPTFGALYTLRVTDERYEAFADRTRAVYGAYAFLR